MTFICLQFKSDISDLPVLDPSMRAIPLAPSEWRDKLEAINRNDPHSKDYPKRDYILLDVRNGIHSTVPKWIYLYFLNLIYPFFPAFLFPLLYSDWGSDYVALESNA
jgi:hypothetical protein